jgi:copper chaperone CopZ
MMGDLKRADLRSVTGRSIASTPRAGPDYRRCPVCGEQGVRVLKVTVATHVPERFWSLLSEGFYFCKNPSCEMFYFNNTSKTYFLKDEVKTRFGLKERDPPRPICYCLQVTEEMIEEEILKKGCCDSLEDIVAFTRAGTGKWCLTTNPSGKCCKEYLGQIVNRYLELAKGTAAEHAIVSLAAQLKAPTLKVEMKVEGMTCEGCEQAVRAAIEALGGSPVSVSYRQGRAVALIPAEVTVDEVLAALDSMGYRAKVERIDRAPRA